MLISSYTWSWCGGRSWLLSTSTFINLNSHHAPMQILDTLVDTLYISGHTEPGPQLWETSFLLFVNIQLPPSLSSVSYISITYTHVFAWLELIIWIGSSRAANEISPLEMSTNQSVSGSGAAAVERDQNWSRQQQRRGYARPIVDCIWTRYTNKNIESIVD